MRKGEAMNMTEVYCPIKAMQRDDRNGYCDKRNPDANPEKEVRMLIPNSFVCRTIRRDKHGRVVYTCPNIDKVVVLGGKCEACGEKLNEVYETRRVHTHYWNCCRVCNWRYSWMERGIE